MAEVADYQREGLLRSHQEIGGTRRDMLLYAITRPWRTSYRWVGLATSMPTFPPTRSAIVRVGSTV